MNSRILAIITLALIPVGVRAGNPETKYNGDGYVFYGVGQPPGGGATLQQIGGGGEGFLYKGLAAGAELGYQYSTEGFSYGIGILSLNGSYHFGRSRKVVPFVTGGYSLAFRGGHANLYNFGGGVTWWIAKHIGVRVDARDYVWPSRCSPHSPQFTMAVSFR